ncbi:MAG: ABC transporter permease [Desulfobacterales bacterium]|nr:ABC transporter permease [Desulfobacterales bacterium]
MNRWFAPIQMAHLVAAHFKEVSRQPAVFFWGIIFPILISLGLGLAFTQQTEVDRQIAIIDKAEPGDAHVKSGQLASFLETRATRISSERGTDARYQLTLSEEHLGTTRFVFIKTTWPQALKLLKRGRISLIMTEENRNIRYHFDPANPEAQITYLKLSKVLSGEAPGDAGLSKNVEPLTVQGSRYIDFLIPGLISMGIMMSCMWGISYGMIEKRSKKMLRRMVATPMRKSHFLLALMVVRIAMNVIEAGLLFLFAWIAFDIVIQGSLAALFVIFMAGNIAFGGIAILTSSHTANTEIGNGLINAVVLPMSVLSGIFFSYHNFPDWSLPVIEKLPLTLLADGIRSIFIEGAGFAETAGPSVLLFAIGIFFFSLGLRVFKWH